MSNCGCDGNNLNILQRNNLMPNQNNQANNSVVNVQSMNNMPQVNSYPQVNNQPAQVQQVANNQDGIGPINNLIKDEELPIVVEEKNTYREDAKMVIYFLLALSIHDAVKFFISQSIRMNRGSSSRFVYYPVVVLALLILINIF